MIALQQLCDKGKSRGLSRGSPSLHPENLADTCQQVPEVQQEVDDDIHAALIARKASDGNLP
jgi:hypothetical protein